MTAVARYALADYLRSQRFLPPLVTYLAFLAIFYAFEGPVLPGYGAGAATLLPVAVWLTLGLHNTEDRLQALVTAVNAGGHRRALFGKTYAALVCVLVLTAVALLWPALSAAHLPAPADLAVGVCAHLICGLTGIALGTCCVRPLVERQGYAFAAAALLSLIALVGRWVTPVNETVRVLSDAPPRPPAAELLLLAAWAVAMLLGLTLLTARLGQRRR
ncbi:hypothetical protein PZB75_20700 [Streptomyces sp. AM 4-1-1]|uniref:hypothetical protein n=1 Tax=Streptomyces sp. AM 4-1-1 TaxID=3028710 RepID=UPI0023BA16E8|nr:hypothetical protein [Streptomyces sp. AM 4-1-1]WEH35559.1 hypothetical protein PZB75_20700 [Streptomyces sp. AM 4-1-1]